MTKPTLIPILGDQLTRTLASLRGQSKTDSVILMMEVWDEATYVKHHKQKIALIFSAMRHFAAELSEAGWRIDYVKLTDTNNAGSFTGEVARAIERHDPAKICIVEASEWRVRQSMDEWHDKFACEVEVLPDDRFICSQAEFDEWAKGRKELRMEFFYREMRKKTGLLIDESGKPVGEKWNLDAENRASPDAKMDPPPCPKFAPDQMTQEVIELVEDRFGDHFGNLENFGWPVTRADAEKAADAFFAERLPDFGKYQDAMVHGSDDLYHSMLSTSINCGLLDPLELCQRAAKAYQDGDAPLNSVEGFIRQIIGWREYVRGFYWHQMPGLAEANELGAARPLPEFYWTGETGMRCLADSIRSTHDNAHAHHIQRLMVLGNFALLSGVAPSAVEDWYLAVYADAYEWVELPNVAAMVLYADGGKLASKPYAASGNYINKMSDYCKECAYSPSKKTGEGACPFNPLYWHFMDRHRERLSKNHRIGRIYSTWDRMGEEKQRDYLDSAEAFLETLEPAKDGWARH
ncbi:cryptochrome/photolyase family protein [Qipengyuania sp. DGS5-3]|uniref:cryptochrome/photolyase family protein n=1 Tax=Qipengyuania sp. DGS5-3 TaxID=3349632 RepID=UPI0036D2818B